MDRRTFLLGAGAAAGAVSLGALPTLGRRGAAAAEREVRRYGDVELVRRKASSDAPNVLFISIDDCNDWVGFLNPHPGTRTPNLDALAAQSLSFDHAYCTAPMCGPARTSITFGSHPFRNGVYDHSDTSDAAYKRLQAVTPSIVDDFWAAGYQTVGAGKIYHGQLPKRWDRYRLTDWYVPGDQRDQPGARYDPDWRSPYDGSRIGDGRDFPVTQIDFGPSGVDPAHEPDGEAAAWVRQQLRSMSGTPFFLGFGNYIPHEPWRVPQKFLDMHPLDEVVLPAYRPDDLDDLPAYARDHIIDQHERFETIREAGVWRKAVQAYQAAISFADDRVGTILDELASSPFADETIVAVWSDHGYHMGEKLHIEKFTLWERSTRVPFLLHVPGRFDHARRFDAPVSTIDMGPTLSDLCGIDTATPYAGGSLLPIVADPDKADDRPPITTWEAGNHAVRKGPWRYIRYGAGGRELYDHRSDPEELTNLASDAAHWPRIAELDAYLPND